MQENNDLAIVKDCEQKKPMLLKTLQTALKNITNYVVNECRLGLQRSLN